MLRKRVYSDEEIEDRLDLVAELIDRYGEVYWPIFDFLDEELSNRQAKSQRLEQRLARSSVTS